MLRLCGVEGSMYLWDEMDWDWSEDRLGMSDSSPKSPNPPQPTITHSQSPVNASTNHILPTNVPIITTANSFTPIRNHRRRRKRKTTTNRYWRRHNHNIQLDSNAIINLSNATLTHDETQLLARGLSFCPTPRKIDWTELRADFYEFSRRMRLLEFFHDYPPQTISQFVDYHLKPLVQTTQSFIKDTTHFLNKLQQLGQ